MQQVSRTLLLLPVLWASSMPLCGTGVITAATDRQAGAVPPHLTRQGFLAPPVRKDPFERLFAPPKRQASLPASPQQREPEPRPKVVCGMVLIPADPSIDPRIRFEAPKRDTRFTIRAVQPPVCWPE